MLFMVYYIKKVGKKQVKGIDKQWISNIIGDINNKLKGLKMTREQKEGWTKIAEIMEEYNLELNAIGYAPNKAHMFLSQDGITCSEIHEWDTLAADDIYDLIYRSRS